MYIAIVGPTGITKSASSEIAIRIFERAHAIQPIAELMKEKLTSWYLYDWFKRMTDTKGECRAYIFAPEMKNFLGDLNKSEIVTLLTSYYGCPETSSYRTKTDKEFIFKNICLNLLVCSTPEWLTTGTTTDEIAGGFTGRFLYVFASDDERSVPFPEDLATPETKQLEDDLIHDLVEISKLRGQFILTDQARAEYVVWYNNRKSEWTDERMRGYYARKGETVLKLSMALSVSRDDSLVIDENILRVAWKMLKSLEDKMSGALCGVVDDPALRFKEYVLATLKRMPGFTCSRSKLLQIHWHQLDAQILDRVIQTLEDAGIIATLAKQNKKTGRIDSFYTIVDTNYQQ